MILLPRTPFGHVKRGLIQPPQVLQSDALLPAGELNISNIFEGGVA